LDACSGVAEVCGGVDETVDFGVLDGQNIVCTASNSISFLSGFLVENNGKFSARIIE